VEDHLDLITIGKNFSYAAAKNILLYTDLVLSSGGLHPQASYRGFAMDCSGDFRLPDPLTSCQP